MKITKSHLRKIIKEEIKSLTENTNKKELSKLQRLAKKRGMREIKNLSQITKLVGNQTSHLVEKGSEPICLFVDPEIKGTWIYIVNEYPNDEEEYRAIYSVESEIATGYIDELEDISDPYHVFWDMQKIARRDSK